MVCPNLYVQNGLNPLKMKFPFIFHQKKFSIQKQITLKKTTHKKFYIPLTKVSSQSIAEIHFKVGPY